VTYFSGSGFVGLMRLETKNRMKGKDSPTRAKIIAGM
jgi:hypothetical protein